MNLKANFEQVPKFSCEIPSDGIWIAKDYNYNSNKQYTNVLNTFCNVIKGISQLRIIVPNYTRAGTDGSIRFKFNFSNRRTCMTNILNNKGNDLATDSDNLYQNNNLGDCFNMDLSEAQCSKIQKKLQFLKKIRISKFIPSNILFSLVKDTEQTTLFLWRLNTSEIPN